ncbi:MAG: TonB-dependent receptor, partial [Nitrosomonadaceae bacterium]|nr:TonB-dependent receptor [Nitrosomonadaceae bacterium]
MIVPVHKKTMRTTKRYLLFFILYSVTNAGFATQNTPLKQDISDASLTELMNTKISTVSRKLQTLSDTPAAVFVISQEDIRRSSANSIPELLRMAPGLSVARIDANKWSVTSRGYSGRFADDLLVMVDGRTVYSPLFAGTFWETLDLPLEDIERIEVIRGPGGTIWGANAANGAIHIITKHARTTQGNLITSGGGSEERGFTTLRHGGKIGDSFFYRFFTKGFARDNSFSPNGANDSWRMGTVGFRADWDVNDSNVRQTVDVDFQHRFPLQIPFVPIQQDIVWGGGYRWTTDHLGVGLPISFDPARRNLQTGNVFAQTDVPLVEDRLKLTAGIKFLDNTYSHGNFLPNARLLWTPDAKQSIWASATRSIRLPSRFERDG